MNWEKRYYDHVLNEKKLPLSTSEEIVYNIIKDFTDRRGLRQEWEGIEDKVKTEIVEKWINSTEKVLKSRE